MLDVSIDGGAMSKLCNKYLISTWDRRLLEHLKGTAVPVMCHTMFCECRVL